MEGIKGPKKNPNVLHKRKITLSTLPYFFDAQHLGHYPDM
jgi:hypothetical protein